MNDLLTVICGDALEKLRELPNESVQCCVTSPPYWGLRDYGTANWEGGDAECDHAGSHAWATDTEQAKKRVDSSMPYRGDCGKCGAKRIDSQVGLEKTPEEYVAKIIEVFREVRRVLRKDGTLWLNLGDSYNGSSSTGGLNSLSGGGSLRPNGRSQVSDASLSRKIDGLKPKDLCGIPWRVAFALQADGWWLRQDIIWSKPNPMPESCTDRCTKAHEYLFLLTKSAQYYYDNEAIQEKSTWIEYRASGMERNAESYRAKVKTPDGWDTSKGNGGHGSFHKEGREKGHTGYQRKPRKHDDTNHGGDGTGFQNHSGYSNLPSPDVRNKRSVWTVTTQPYPEAHFATYPPDLIKPCVLAGTKTGDTVLDPFAGSGTTGQVSLELARKAILIELNPEYCDLIKQRCNVTLGLAL